MRINEVSHERVRNLGNFESVRVTLTAIVDEDDDHREVLDILKEEAKAFLFPKEATNNLPTVTNEQIAECARHEIADKLDDDDIPY